MGDERFDTVNVMSEVVKKCSGALVDDGGDDVISDAVGELVVVVVC